LSCPEDKVRFAITKEGFRDTVVWNPWIEGAKKIGDLAPEEYPHMLCIESANVLSPVTLEAGDVYTSAQIFELRHR
jgi:glucose-6-phosphate 1-epimerase